MNQWRDAQLDLLFLKFDPYPLLGIFLWMFVPSYELAIFIGLMLVSSMWLQRLKITFPIALRMLRFNLTFNFRSNLPFERRRRMLDNG